MLARLADHPTSVVLTDLQMEGMDGLHLVWAIRNEHPQVPVIVMTGSWQRGCGHGVSRVGATDYVPKQRLAQDLHAVLGGGEPVWATAENRRRRRSESLVLRESHFDLGHRLTSFPRSSNSFRTR